MKKIFVFIVLFLFSSFSFWVSLFDFSWKVEKIYDGDTIRVNNQNVDIKIRLLWIDTPELYHWQKVKTYKFYGCWEKSKNIAVKLLLNKYVKVYKDSLAKNRWKYGRILRYIKIPLKYRWKLIDVDYGAIMVYLWLAKVYKRENFENKSLYYKLQDIAKKHKRWIWSTKCILEDKKIKEEYQKKELIKNKWESIIKKQSKKLDIKHKPKKESKDKKIITKNIIKNNTKKEENTLEKCGYTYHKTWCDIKGNISRKWVKIYHIPWWRYYKVTKITPKKWERWFCNEKTAISCGWRASYVR